MDLNARNREASLRSFSEKLAGFARRQHRDDLAERIEGELSRDTGASPTLVVIGEVSHGKSSLVNAILDARILPTGADVVTQSYTIIRHSEQPFITEVRESGTAPAEELGNATSDQILTFQMERSGTCEAFEIGWNHPILERGLVVIDTPGVGGLTPAHDALTAMALRLADSLLLVLDSKSPVSASEINLARGASDRVATCLVAMTKIDEAPSWRDLMAADEYELRQIGDGFGETEVLPVSSKIWEVAKNAEAEGKSEIADALLEESGVSGLRREIEKSVLDSAAELRSRNLARLCHRVLASMKKLDAVEEDPNSDDAERKREACRAKGVELENLIRGLHDRINPISARLRAEIPLEVGHRATQLTLAWRAKIETEPDPASQEFADSLSNAMLETEIELVGWLEDSFAEQADLLAKEIDIEMNRGSLGLDSIESRDLVLPAYLTRDSAGDGFGVTDAQQQGGQMMMMANMGMMAGTAIFPVAGTAIGGVMGAMIGLCVGTLGRKERVNKAKLAGQRANAQAFAVQVIQNAITLQTRSRLEQLLTAATLKLNEALKAGLEMDRTENLAILQKLQASVSESAATREKRREGAKSVHKEREALSSELLKLDQLLEASETPLPKPAGRPVRKTAPTSSSILDDFASGPARLADSE